MKIKTLIITLLIALPLFSIAQQKHGGQCHHEEIMVEKVSFLTTNLDLTVNEAQNFWPVYNEFQNKLKENSEEIFTIRKDLKTNIDNLSDEKINEKIDRMIELESEKADITSNYNEKFKKVLPIKKVALLYNYERDFRRHLLEKYRSKGKSGMQRPRPKPE
jgi:3-dehydroquinate dehydratase